MDASGRVLYPGTFDPVHLGHLDVVAQAATLFGTVVLAVLHNHDKAPAAFEVERRIELITEAVAADDSLAGRVEVRPFEGLAVAAAAGVDFIVRGLRSAADFEIEQQMAHTNRSVTGVHTVYVPCAPALGYISSRFVREIARYRGTVDHMVPASVADALRALYSDQPDPAQPDPAQSAPAQPDPASR
jgi:pantetheine-phosphate adenylyltransferase